MKKINFDEYILKMIMKEYDLGEIQKFSSLQGWTTSPYYIETSTGRYVLKFYESYVNSVDKVTTIAEVIDYLSKQNTPVHKVYPTKSGDLLTSIFFLKINKYGVIFEFLEGGCVNFEKIKQTHVFEVGKELKKLSSSLSSFNYDNELWMSSIDFFEKDLKNYCDRLEHNLGHNHLGLDSSVCKLLEERWVVDQKLLKKLGKALNSVEESLIHADLTVDNVLFQNDKVTGIFDFDWMRKGFLEEDIAISLGAWMLNSRTISVEECIDSFFRGFGIDYNDTNRLFLIFAFLHFYLWREIGWATDYVDDERIKERNLKSLNTFVSKYQELINISINSFKP